MDVLAILLLLLEICSDIGYTNVIKLVTVLAQFPEISCVLAQQPVKSIFWQFTLKS